MTNSRDYNCTFYSGRKAVDSDWQATELFFLFLVITGVYCIMYRNVSPGSQTT